MNEDHQKVANNTRQDKSCDVIGGFQPGHLVCEDITSPIREKEDLEQFCEPENESEDACADANRFSQCSNGTENSILSSHLSLQVHQALNGSIAQNDNHQNRNLEEICLNEKDSSRYAETAADKAAVFRELDLSCSRPLLNGHTMDDETEITTQKPQGPNSERKNSNTSKIGGRVLRFFENRRSRSWTTPVHFNRPNDDVVITIDEEESNIQEPRQPKATSSSCFNVRLKGWLQPMENKMNMKVFGSRRAMAEEVLRYKKAGWIIHPTSAFRFEIIIVYLRRGKKILFVNLYILFIIIILF